MSLPDLFNLGGGGAGAVPPSAPQADPSGQARIEAALARALDCGIDEQSINAMVAEWQAKWGGAAGGERSISEIEQWVGAKCARAPGRPPGNRRLIAWIGGGVLLAGAIAGAVYFSRKDDDE